jgi:hypothetical protein
MGRRPRAANPHFAQAGACEVLGEHIELETGGKEPTR